jgi:hypothetical protein
MTLATLNTLINTSAQNLSQFKGLSAAYGVLLGGAPSIDGYTFLINENNTTNFGAGGTTVFNDENIYINTINALYKGNTTAKSTFDAIISSAATIQDALTLVYNYVIPASLRTTAGLDYFKSQATYFATRAAEIDNSGLNGTALVGFASLIKIAVDSDIGGLGDTINDLRAAVGNGTAALPQGGDVLTALETADGTQFDTDDVVIVPNPGQTFTLTNSVDTGPSFKGGSANDTYNASLTNDGFGVANVETLNALDSLDGGAGNDTLNYFTDNGAAVPGATLANIETLNIVSGAGVTADVSGANVSGLTTLTARAVAAAVDIDVKANVTSVTVTGTATTVAIDDAGTATTTADKLTSVSVSGNTGALTVGATNSVDSLTTLSLAKTSQNATVTAAAGSRALTVNLNEVAGGIITDATATGLTVNASGVKSSGVTLTAGAATAVTLDATGVTLGVTDVNIGAAKTLTVTGDKVVTIGATTGVGVLTTVTSAASTGGVTITPTLATGVTFTGGAGKDTVSLTAGTLKASTLGAGDDKVTLTGAFGAGGSVDGGEGTDTLQMASADAATVSATTTFKTGFTNFEKMSVGAVLVGATDTVQLANLNDLNYVVSAGTAPGVLGSTETALVTFQNLKSGQSTTVAGRVITATAGDLTAAQVEAAYLSGTTAGAAVVSGTLADFTVAQNGVAGDGILAFTATTAGSVTDISSSSANAAAPTAPAVTTTQGVPALTESSVVKFQGLIAGETVTVASRVVTATAITETATVTFTDLTGGGAATTQTVIMGGRTVTLTSAGASVFTAAEIAAAVATGSTATAGTGTIAVTGTLNPIFSGASAGAVATFTSTVTNSNVGNIGPVTGTGYVVQPTVTTVEGNNGNLTAAQVASAMGSGTTAGAAVVSGVLTGFTAGVASGNSVTFTSSGAGNVTNIGVTTTAGTAPTVTTTDGVTAITETSSLVFSGLLSGQSIIVGDLVLTATNGDLTAAQVAEAFDGDGGNNALAAVLTGGAGGLFTNPTGFTAGAIITGSTVVFTSANPGNVTDITTGISAAAAPTALGVVTTEGGVGAAGGGALNVTGFSPSGTFELTGAINGASSLALANTSGTSDEITIKLNGTSNIVNTAATTIANVETIKIQTTDSQVVTSSTPIDIDPTTASTILLAAAGATKIVVSGNHGVDFTGSTLTALVNLDASGVVATGIAGANQTASTTAANIGTGGAVTFSSSVNNKAVTVTTGNGADVISVASVNNATFLATGVTAATVTTGEGNDTITGSAGKDVIDAGAGRDVITGGARADTITTGAGNDRVVLNLASESTLANKDVITDFTANTFGNGTSGAAGTGAANASATSFTGDVIDLRAFIAGPITKVSVAVVATESAATISLQNVGDATTDTIAIALDSTTGNVYFDVNSDGVADSVMTLTGVSTLTNAAFLVA